MKNASDLHASLPDLTPCPSPKGEGWLAPNIVSLLPLSKVEGWLAPSIVSLLPSPLEITHYARLNSRRRRKIALMPCTFLQSLRTPLRK
ncbi:MAG: hypothetical protein LBB79_08810 [Prevotellaceae bacterium]|nr:hypothetical protein [Prevotellaceae bacterium]